MEETRCRKAEEALQIAGIAYCKEEPLKCHTSFQIGGPAAFFCTPGNICQLRAVLQLAKDLRLPYTLLGRGSNVIFPDDGYPGLVICPKGGLFEQLEVGAEGKIHAGAGVNLHTLCEFAQQKSLAGLAFAYGIPGGVGGAIFMNAGAYGGEIAGVLESVLFLDENLQERRLPAGELGLGYRQSVFQTRPWVIVSATFCLQPAQGDDIYADMKENLRKREEKQPLEWPSAGSAFKRPPGAFAGALIDECGLRGYRVGNAAISEKHCGFIVNLGGASCADVLTLADEVCSRVEAQTGYRLEKEIRVVEAR